jgi:MYXO-CTERM domain-containing protein
VCECKEQACHSPCFGIICDEGLSCVPTGWAKGTCREENCYLFGCDAGEVCLGGLCRTDPCVDSPCADDEVCEPDTDYEGYVCTESCAGVRCEAEERCVEGRCVSSECDPACADDEVCRSNADGDFECGSSLCEERDGVPTCSDGSYCDPVTGSCGDFPCAGVYCPADQHCREGECVADEEQGAGGGSSESAPGGAAGEPSASAEGAESRERRDKRWGLATGGSWCAHRPGSPSSPHAWILVLGGLIALRRRRRGCRSDRVGPEQEVQS